MVRLVSGTSTLIWPFPLFRETDPGVDTPPRNDRLEKLLKSPPTRTLVDTSPAGSLNSAPLSKASICPVLDTDDPRVAGNTPGGVVLLSIPTSVSVFDSLWSYPPVSVHCHLPITPLNAVPKCVPIDELR